MRAGLDRFRRALATAACYGLFGVGSVLIAMVAAPVLYLFVRCPARRATRARYLISSCFAVFIGTARALGALDYRVEHRERLQRPGCVVVANHPSLIDVVFLIALMPGVNCVIKRALWRNPFTAIPVRLAGYIHNSTAPAMVEACQASLAAGNRLIVFPEGTRSQPGRPLHFTRGAAHVALAADAALVPVIITLNEPALGKGQRWYHVPVDKLWLSLTVDRPIRPSDHRRRDDNAARAARRLTGELQRYFTARLSLVDNGR